MRFLADESCDFAVVRALRAARHDVLAVAECSPGLNDAPVMDLALREQRILLTEDKDFGQLVYANAQPSGGVILIRYPANVRTTLPYAVVSFVKSTTVRLAGSFVVLSPGRIRVGAG